MVLAMLDDDEVLYNPAAFSPGRRGRCVNYTVTRSSPPTPTP
jgi:hypothetical protein